MVAPKPAASFPHRFSVFLCPLDPTMGSEIGKTRPCVVVSPDELNRHLMTVLIAPLTSASRPWVSRVPCRFAGRPGQIALDQMRCLDRRRLQKYLGRLAVDTQSDLAQTLVNMFS